MPLYVMTQFKAFCITEAEVAGVRPETISDRFRRRKYGWLVVQRYSTWDVRISGTTLPRPKPKHAGYFTPPPEGAVTFKEWLTEEAGKLGIKTQALYMRINRGRHPAPTFFRGGRLRNEYVLPG